MPQLDPAWFPSQLFWLCVAFVVLYLGVRMILPVFDRVFADRNKIVDDNIKVAADLRDEAKRILKEYNDGIASANEKSAQIMSNAKKEMEDFIKEKDAEFDKKSSEMLKQSRLNLEKAEAEAVDTVKKMVSDLTETVYRKVTNRDILKEQVGAAVDKVFNEQDKKDEQ